MSESVQAVAQHSSEVERQRAEFPSVFGMELDSKTATLGRRRGVEDEAVREYLGKMTSIELKLMQVGIQPATIINMNPYPLRVNGVLVDDIVVPACPSGRPYTWLVIRDVRYSRREEVECRDTPVDWHPIQLARDFNDHFYSRGGVVIYTGDADKEDPSVTSQKLPELKRNMDEARERQLAFMRSRIEECNAAWNSPNSMEKKAITDLDRTFAMVMADFTGEELPSWVNKTPGKFGLGEKCINCGSIPSTDAIMCPNCANVLKPREAYEKGFVDVDNIALTRLSRSVLAEMGISELIDTTVEERNAKNVKLAAEKRTAKGKK